MSICAYMDTQVELCSTSSMTKANTLPTDAALELIAARFRVLGEANRLRLIRALESGEKSVNQLMTLTGLTQANTSRHLQHLTQAGILARRREGLNVIYCINDPGILELCALVCGSMQRQVAQQARVINSPAERA